MFLYLTEKNGELPISIPFVKNQCLHFHTTNSLIKDICILHTMFILCTILRGKKSSQGFSQFKGYIIISVGKLYERSGHLQWAVTSPDNANTDSKGTFHGTELHNLSITFFCPIQNYLVFFTIDSTLQC